MVVVVVVVSVPVAVPVVVAVPMRDPSPTAAVVACSAHMGRGGSAGADAAAIDAARLARLKPALVYFHVHRVIGCTFLITIPESERESSRVVTPCKATLRTRKRLRG